MSNTKFYQLILILILIPAFAIIHYNAENHLTGLLWNLGILISLWIFRIISNGISNRQMLKIMRANNRTSAKIISVKVFKDTYVLQLNITGTDGPYISSYVLSNPDSTKKEKYRQGQNLNIFINPVNKYDLVIPEEKKQKQSTGINIGGIFWTIVIASSLVLPVLFSVFDTSDRVLKDVVYITDNQNNGNIWEVRFKPYSKIFIRIENPVSGKTLKKFKEKKEFELDYYTDFKIFEQNSKVIIVGYGDIPVYDVYNANNFEKISGIVEFEQSNKKLKSGIVKIKKESVNSRFAKDNFIEITTTDGITCFYNIEKDLFFYSDKELKAYVEKTENDIISEHLTVFALSPVSESNYQDKLYAITSEKTNKLDELKRMAGSVSFDPERFNKDKRYNCKKCSSYLLSDETFLEARIAYFDTSIVVLTSLLSMKKDEDDKITGIDKTGKLVFVVQGNAYPNKDLMEERDYKPSSQSDLEFIRTNKEMVIIFKEYGAIGIDLNTGKVLWKYEP